MPETILIHENGSVAHLTLNRPDARNAMSNQMVREVRDYFTRIRENRSLRAVVIGAAGTTFCAGGDIRDLQAEANMSMAEKIATMRDFDAMLHAVNTAPQVTIARIQGAALGGGLGLVCVTDLAIAGESARFALPEVRLGLAPALISPYVLQRLGLTRARALMLTGERFDAAAALNYGLIHAACADDDLDSQVQAMLEQVLQGSPQALAATKALIFAVMERPSADTLDYRADLISRLRESEEGQQGMLAFIQKQKAPWVP